MIRSSFEDPIPFVKHFSEFRLHFIVQENTSRPFPMKTALSLMYRDRIEMNDVSIYFWSFVREINLSKDSRLCLKFRHMPAKFHYKFSQQCHISRNLEMRRLLLEMWMWVRGMCISKGDDTPPVGNDRISCGRFARISKFRDMWHYSIFL